MEILEAIHSRRSIRLYNKEPVTRGDIEKVLAAGMQAPSAGHEEPWHFIVITDREKLNRMMDFSRYLEMLKTAPVAILTCADLNLQKFEGYWVLDCAAAMQNMLLAAHGLKLGAVWTGVYPNEQKIKDFSNLFGLPEKVVPHSLMVLGHPAEVLPSEDRYRPDRIHNNDWQTAWM